MFERRLHFHLDWAMLIAVMALCFIGLANIYSATGGPTGIYVTQIYGIVLGLVALAICLAIDYRTLVLLRSGPGGVPPVPFRLVKRGRYYDVWRQPG